MVPVDGGPRGRARRRVGAIVAWVEHGIEVVVEDGVLVVGGDGVIEEVGLIECVDLVVDPIGEGFVSVVGGIECAVLLDDLKEGGDFWLGGAEGGLVEEAADVGLEEVSGELWELE